MINQTDLTKALALQHVQGEGKLTLILQSMEQDSNKCPERGKSLTALTP